MASSHDNTMALWPNGQYGHEHNNALQFHKIFNPEHSHPFILNFAVTEDHILKMEIVNYYHLKFRALLRDVFEGISEEFKQNINPAFLNFAIKNTNILDYHQLEALCNEAHNIMNLLSHGCQLDLWLLESEDESAISTPNIFQHSVSSVHMNLSPFNTFARINDDSSDSDGEDGLNVVEHHVDPIDGIEHDIGINPLHYLGLPIAQPPEAPLVQNPDGGWYAHGFWWENVPQEEEEEEEENMDET